MKATAGASAGWIGQAAAAAMTLEPKRFTMRRKVVNDAAVRPHRNIGLRRHPADRRARLSRIVHRSVLK
jgi:hypothetical protein